MRRQRTRRNWKTDSAAMGKERKERRDQSQRDNNTEMGHRARCFPVTFRLQDQVMETTGKRLGAAPQVWDKHSKPLWGGAKRPRLGGKRPLDQ